MIAKFRMVAAALAFFGPACQMAVAQESLLSPRVGDCKEFSAARNHAYIPYIRGVTEDVKMIASSNPGANFDPAMKELASGYERKAATGDVSALRKLIGIGLFSAFAAKREPLEVTFKLTCEAAKKGLPPQNVLDPLACAVIALDGSRQQSSANISLARSMIDIAKVNLSVDSDRAGAQKLFDTLVPLIQRCTL